MRPKTKTWKRACCLVLALGLLFSLPAPLTGMQAYAEDTAVIPATSETAQAQPDETETPAPDAEQTAPPETEDTPSEPEESPGSEASAEPSAEPSQQPEPEPSAQPVPKATANPTAKPTATPTAKPTKAPAATGESALALYAASSSQAIPSNHLDVEADSAFYMLVNDNYYYASLDLEKNTAEMYAATATQAAAMSGEHGAQVSSVSGVSCTVDVDESRNGTTTSLYKNYTMTGNWQSNGSRGMEYRFNGRENGNRYTFYKDAAYTVTLHIAYSFAALGTTVPVNVSYAETVTYSGSGNVCPGSGNQKGIDVSITGSELTEYFTQGRLCVQKLVDGQADPGKTFDFVLTPSGTAESTPIRLSVTSGTPGVTSLAPGTYTLTESEDETYEHFFTLSGVTTAGSVSFSIVAGQQTEITVDNRTPVRRANLTIRKQVTGTDAADVPFGIKIVLSQTGPVDYTLYSAQNAALGTGQISSGDTLTLKAGQYAVLEKLTIGTAYTLTEPNLPADYTLDSTQNASGTLTADVTATFVNRLHTYVDLTVEKLVEGTTATDVPFGILVTLDCEGVFPYTRYNVDDTVAETGNVQSGDTLTLTAGQYAVIHHIEIGTAYTLTEPNLPTDYTLDSTQNASGTLTADVTATFVNRLHIYTTLTVHEEVEGTTATDVPFDILVTLDHEGSFPYTLYTPQHNEAGHGEVKNGDTLTLTAGQTAVIDGLEVGTKYCLTEPSQPAGYTLKSLQNTDDTLNAAATAELVSSYEATGSLHLPGHKTLLSMGGKALQANQFTFISTRQQPGDIQTATNTANGNFEFAYHYTVADAGCSYTYRIAEQQKTDAYTYDDAVYLLQVEISDCGDGTLDIESELTRNGRKVDALTFCNVYETVALTLDKVWDDKDHESHRPDCLTYTLIGRVNGESKAISRVSVNAENWDYTWSDLPRYDRNHNEITYTVEESDSGSRYTGKLTAGERQWCKQDGKTTGYKQTLTLTNTYCHKSSDDDDDEDECPVTTVLTPAPVAQLRYAPRVQTGDTTPIQLGVSAGLLCAAGISLFLIHKKKR